MTENLRTGKELIVDLAEKYNIEYEIAESIIADFIRELMRAFDINPHYINLDNLFNDE